MMISWRVDYGPGVEQRSGEQIMRRLHSRISLGDHGSRAIAVVCRPHPRGQVLAVCAHHDLALAVLTGEVGQRAGFTECHSALVARLVLGAGEEVAAEGAGRNEGDLIVFPECSHLCRQRFVSCGW